MDAICRPLKIYILPFLARGHLIPFSQFARVFASRGLHVTIITTPLNAQFLEKSVNGHQNSGHVISIHSVKFPSEELGLPNTTQNLFDVTDSQTAHKILTAVDLLRHQVEPFVEQHPPDCIVSDFLFTWTSDLATRLGIPRVVCNTFSLFSVCAIDAVKRCNYNYASAFRGPFVVPGLPHAITLTVPPPGEAFQRVEALLEAELNSYGLIVNSFVELDGEEYIPHYYNKISHNHKHKVWHIGPVSLMLRNSLQQKGLHETSVISHDDDEHERVIRSWLDSKESESVIYISFGSMCRFPDKQLVEIAYGVESSGHNFIWVVHREAKKDEDEKAWLPEGFEERMKKEKRGMILMKWAPQELILNHAATGGFMTHCGSTSLPEGIGAGVPMVTWPAFAEHFYNEKLITQVHGFGVEVGVEEWMRSPYESREKLVSREKIERAMRRLMEGGDESKEVRRKAREMGEKARKAVEEGGSSHRNLTALIEDLKRIAANRSRS